MKHRSNTERKQGPRRMAWERLKRRLDRLRIEIAQEAVDLASWNDNHGPGEQIHLPPYPALPQLPPMPAWEQ